MKTALLAQASAILRLLQEVMPGIGKTSFMFPLVTLAMFHLFNPDPSNLAATQNNHFISTTLDTSHPPKSTSVKAAWVIVLYMLVTKPVFHVLSPVPTNLSRMY